jgi:hypothetical protein
MFQAKNVHSVAAQDNKILLEIVKLSLKLTPRAEQHPVTPELMLQQVEPEGQQVESGHSTWSPPQSPSRVEFCKKLL